MKNGSLLQTMSSNISDGQLYNNLWQISAGRLFQIPALFMFGIILGRMNCFVKSEKSINFWIRVAIWSLFILIFPLSMLKNYIPALIENAYILKHYDRIMLSLWNFTSMGMLISLFSLLWFYKGNGYTMQRFIIPYGKMSLSNYIFQSILGCAIYLNWGIGLYQYTGAIFSIIIAFAMFALQLSLSNWWLSKYRQGPLEWIWKKLTWVKV